MPLAQCCWTHHKNVFQSEALCGPTATVHTASCCSWWANHCGCCCNIWYVQAGGRKAITSSQPHNDWTKQHLLNSLLFPPLLKCCFQDRLSHCLQHQQPTSEPQCKLWLLCNCPMFLLMGTQGSIRWRLTYLEPQQPCGRTWMEFMAPASILVQTWLLCPFDKWTRRWKIFYFTLYFSFCRSFR